MTARWVVVHLMILTLAVTFVSLGMWQLRRNDERRLENAVSSARLRQEPAPLESLVASAGGDFESVEHRRANVTGEFDPGNEVLIRSQLSLGNAGFHVVTPLILASGEGVLVNRGWVPLVLDEVPVTDAPPPAGEVTLEGWIRLTQTRSALGPTDPGTGRLATMSRVDIDRIAAQVPYQLAPIYLVELSARADRLPVLIGVPAFDDNGPHLAYAIQWFSFAAIGLIGHGFLIRRSIRIGT